MSNENYVSTRVRLYKNFKTESSMPLLPDPYLLAKELKCIPLQCSVCLNTLKAILPSLNVELYG